MKALLFTFLVILAASPASAYDETRLLASIRQIETGDDPQARGATGELSAYQITRRVWRQHMGQEPFSAARNPARADACALKHLRWLAAGIRRQGFEPTPARLAMAWNVGLTGAIRRELQLTDYARRTLNLYASVP